MPAHSENPLSIAAVQAALAANAPPGQLRRLVRRLAPIVHAAVVRAAGGRAAAPDATRRRIAGHVEAIIWAWFAHPDAVLLAPRSARDLEAWFAARAAEAAAEVTAFAWEVGDDARLPATATREATRRFVAGLDPWARTVFTLIYVERRSPVAAARSLGVESAVVEQARARLRARLRAFFDASR